MKSTKNIESTPETTSDTSDSPLIHKKASEQTCGRYGPLMEGNGGTVFRWL